MSNLTDAAWNRNDLLDIIYDFEPDYPYAHASLIAHLMNSGASEEVLQEAWYVSDTEADTLPVIFRMWMSASEDFRQEITADVATHWEAVASLIETLTDESHSHEGVNAGCDAEATAFVYLFKAGASASELSAAWDRWGWALSPDDFCIAWNLWKQTDEDREWSIFGAVHRARAEYVSRTSDPEVIHSPWRDMVIGVQDAWERYGSPFDY